MTIKTFDGSKSMAIGKVDLKFSWLWIYFGLLTYCWVNHGFIWQALYLQVFKRLKFISSNKVITIKIEEELTVTTSSLLPFVDIQKLEGASAYHSFESGIMNYIPRRKSFSYTIMSKI